MSFQFRILKDEPVNKEVEVITSSDRISSTTDAIAQQLQNEAHIDGFRKGKVPLEVIKSKYGKAILAEGVKRIVSEAVTEVLKEKDWQLSQIQDIEIDDDNPTKFTLKIETLPQFELAQYKGIELVSEDEVNEQRLLEAKMDELRQTKAKIQVVGRSARVGDLLVIDLKTPQKKLENTMIELGDRSLPDEMNQALVGMTKSQSKEFQVKIEEDKSENWHITVKELKEKILPDDEQLAHQLGFTSTQEMSEEIQSEVKEDIKKLNRNQLKDKAAQYLIERNKFSLPKGLVEDEYRFILAERKEEDTSSNRERFLKKAEDRVRLTLIINKIASEEKISVQDEEIDKYLTEYGSGLNYKPNQIEELKKNDRVRASITAALLRDRVLDLILNHAQVTKKDRIVSPWSKDDNRSVRNRTNR